MEQSTNTYIGYTYRDDKLWTVEIDTDEKIENTNMHIDIYKFKLLKIEDDTGKIYQKVPNYSINKIHNSGRKSIKVHFEKNNAIMYNLYNDNYDKYSKYTGVIRQYYPNGNLYFEYFLNVGKINGEYKSFYKNGVIKETSFFVNGKRHGITQYYNRNEYYRESHMDDNYDLLCTFDNNNLIDIKIENIKENAIEDIITKESEIDNSYCNIRRDDQPVIVNNKYYNLKCTYITQLDHNDIERFKLNSYEINLSDEFIKHNVEYFMTDIPIDILNLYSKVWHYPSSK